ncbi:phage tail protein [Caenimonas terrae]|uniref:Phage tail protein n=1 Tax=Caenimonas terrae TaxID=696074 RepID=A0ABW0NDY6_9BURK
MLITVKDNFPEVMAQLEQLHKDVREQALVRAVNSTLAQGQTRMAQEISREFNITSREVKDRLQVIKATWRNGLLSVKGVLQVTNKRGRSLNLIHFDARQTPAGVSVKILRSGGRKVLKGAFIANQGRTVFQRVGKTRLPIKAMQTVDVPQMFNTKRINRVVVQLLQDKFPEVFQREAKYYTDRFNAKRAGA